MSEDLRSRLSRLNALLDNFKEGQPLPISLADIHYVFGACGILLKNIDTVEESYKRDMEIASNEVQRFRNKWKEARKLSVILDGRITRMKQIILEAKKLSWWRKTSPLKAHIKGLEVYESKKSISPLSD